MQYKGTVKKVMDAVRITEKFVKREFVVSDTTEKYPQTVMFELTNDRCSQLDGIKEGDEIVIDFQLRGREWTNPKGEVKYFNTLGAFKVVLSKLGEVKPETKQEVKSEVRQTPPIQKQEEVFTPTPDDDLPF